MEIVRATRDDVPQIMRLVESARSIMRANGNMTQWADGYPTEDVIINDITCGNSYLCIEDGKAVATFAMIAGPDPTYTRIYDGYWLRETNDYYVVHRIASTPKAHGVFHAIMTFCLQHTRHLRIDTHRDNTIMQHLLLQHDFTYCGIIRLANNDDRLAYERV